MAGALVSSVLSLMVDPSAAVALFIVAAVTALYMASRKIPPKSPIPLDNQSIVLADGERVSYYTKDGKPLKYMFEDTRTLYQCFQRGKRVSNDGPCLGTRELANGPYKWLTYSQIEERSVAFGAGLYKLGIAPGQSSFLGIYGPNSTEWVIAEQSCNAFSRVSVPLYDTIGREAIIHIMNQAEISCVVCNSSKVKNLISLKGSCPQLNMIVIFEDSIAEDDKKCGEEADIKLYTVKQVEEYGRSDPVDIQPAKPEDLATICYTSGTTGLPKGVMLTNENMISTVSALLLQVQMNKKVSPADSHISYMPLAHMMERSCLVIMFMSGGKTGFFSRNIKTLVNDIQELKPTIFVSVPRLLNRIYDKSMSVVSSSKVKKWLYETGFQSKLAEVKQGIVRNNSLWDVLVFRKIQKMLGGRVRMIISGSAPISSSVMDFLRVAFGCEVYEGYGQTEATTGLTMTHPLDTETGHVGGVLACAQIKLRDVPDTTYSAADGEGEVCYKGPSTTQGYFKNPEKTAELFDEDGWARSGDVGKWLPNGTLKIIDRVKHIFKLSQGEYIAPEKVENVCMRSLYIAQMFLFGDSLKSCCVAIVVPDEEEVLKWAVSYDRKGLSFEELCQDEAVHHVIFEDLKMVARAGGLNSLEIPKAIKLSPEQFSVENGLLTPTFKLKRPLAKDYFHKDIKELYSKIP